MEWKTPAAFLTGNSCVSSQGMRRSHDFLPAPRNGRLMRVAENE